METQTLNIYETFKQTAERNAKRTALKFKYQGTYHNLSFAELHKRVITLGAALQERGILKGDRVAILSENRTEWIRCDLAIAAVGAVCVPIHTTLSPKMIEHVLNDSQAKLIFVSNQELYNKLLLCKSLNFLKQIIYFDLDHPNGPTGITQESLREVMQNSAGKSLNEVEISADDVSSIIYTSGTTAQPKGVMLTHNNFLSNARAALSVLSVTPKDQLLSFLPLSHVLERTAGYYTPLVCAGACVAFAENIKTIKQNLKEIKPTIIVAVPRIFEKIYDGVWTKAKTGSKLSYGIFTWSLKQKRKTIGGFIADKLVYHKIRSAFGGHLRFAVCGGATLNHRLGRFFHKLGIIIVEGYGLTETSPVITCNRLDDLKFGTVGKPLPDVQVKVAPDKEILVKGPNVMKGYFNQTELTAQTIEDGWLHTGDLGFLSSEGYLVIIGRKKEMIALSNGKIAWPEQLESVINADKLIDQSFVYGNSRSFLVALIVPNWQEVLNQLPADYHGAKEPDRLAEDAAVKKIIDDKIAKINQQFAEWEKIRAVAILPTEFSQAKDELTPTLKLRRQKIYEHYQMRIEGLYKN